MIDHPIEKDLKKSSECPHTCCHLHGNHFPLLPQFTPTGFVCLLVASPFIVVLFVCMCIHQTHTYRKNKKYEVCIIKSIKQLNWRIGLTSKRRDPFHTRHSSPLSSSSSQSYSARTHPQPGHTQDVDTI